MREWRIGRSIGRTLYIPNGDVPSKLDICIGMVDSPEFARLIVDAINGLRTIDPSFDARVVAAENRRLDELEVPTSFEHRLEDALAEGIAKANEEPRE